MDDEFQGFYLIPVCFSLFIFMLFPVPYINAPHIVTKYKSSSPIMS